MIENILPDVPAPQQTEIGVKQQQEYAYKGSIRLKRGLKLYSYNFETKELKEVKIDAKILVDHKGCPLKKMKAQYDPKCYYVQALNFKNAQRKVDKLLKFYDYVRFIRQAQERKRNAAK